MGGRFHKRIRVGGELTLFLPPPKYGVERGSLAVVPPPNEPETRSWDPGGLWAGRVEEFALDQGWPEDRIWSDFLSLCLIAEYHHGLRRAEAEAMAFRLLMNMYHHIGEQPD